MIDKRFLIGLVIGIFLSFFMVSLLTMWSIFQFIENYAGNNIIKSLVFLMDANFEFNIIGFFTSETFDLFELLNPQFLSWIFIGYISGTISKGIKRGFFASTLIIVIVTLIWIMLNIISGEDLMAMFQGRQLIATLGGIISSVLGCLIGGVVGGVVSGPHEEF